MRTLSIALLALAAPFALLSVTSATTTMTVWQCGNVECIAPSKKSDAKASVTVDPTAMWDCRYRPCTEIGAKKAG